MHLPHLPDGVHFLGAHDLPLLTPAWTALAEAQAANPMARPEWTQAYLDSYARQRPHTVCLAVLVRAGELHAVLPLVRKRTWGLPCLELLSSSELYEPTELLYRTPAALAELLDATLRQQGCPVVLERHPGHAESLDTLARGLTAAAACRRRPRPGSPRVLLDGNPDHVLNAGRRSDLRRMLRRAEKHGPAHFAVLTPTEAELPALLAEAFRVEAAGWKGAQQSALMQDHAAKAFFERYATLACRAGVLRVATMTLGGQTVAVQLDVVCGGAIWLLKIGYDEAFADCSPGNLLMMEVLRYACQQGLGACEFLGLAARWTRMWTELEYPTESVTLYPHRWAQGWHVGALALRRAATLLRRPAATHFERTPS
ncbi:GNAT family N-acetyltransferase [Hydrogenophaga soli]